LNGSENGGSDNHRIALNEKAKEKGLDTIGPR